MLRDETAAPTASGMSNDVDEATGLQIEGWVAGTLGHRGTVRGGVTMEQWELGLRARAGGFKRSRTRNGRARRGLGAVQASMQGRSDGFKIAGSHINPGG